MDYGQPLHASVQRQENLMRFSILLLLAALTPGIPVVQGAENARLTLVVSTTFGEPIEKAKVVLTLIGPMTRLTAVSGLHGEVLWKNLPFGLYEAEIQSPGFDIRRQTLGVYQREMVYRLGLVLNYPHSDKAPEVFGSVALAAGSKWGLWVRLVPIFGSDVVENAVDQAGNFRLIGMASGRYLLMLLDKEKILATKPVDVLGGSEHVNFSLN